VPGGAERGDLFGSALSVGDFSGDSRADLAIGVPGEGLSTGSGAGAVNTLYGRSNGLSGTASLGISQNSPGLSGSGETNDAFGAALATGDFDGDGGVELGIGAPGEDLGSAANSGTFHQVF